MELFDAYGRQIRQNKPILEEVGGVTGVRDRYSTYPSNGLTPERLASIFREADQGDVLRQAELFEEMEEKDTHLGGILQSRKLAVTGLEWEVVPASDDAEDKRIADFIREALEWIETLDDDLRDVLDAIGKGFSVTEIMWEYSEGQVWADRLLWRHPKKFTFTAIDRVLDTPRLLTDASPTYGEELLPYKFIFHRYKGRSGITPRGGLLRPCAWMYLFKNYDVKDWVIFAERFAMPLRIGKYQPGASDEERKVLRNAVFNLGSDAAAVIADSTIIELLEQQTKGASADIYSKLAEFCERSMSKAVLGHTGSSDSTPGKLGSEDEARDVRQDLLEADAKALARTIKLQLARPLVVYNFGPDKALPKVRFLHEDGEDLETTAKVYREAQGMGLTIGENHMRQKFGIPAPEKGEAVLVPAAPTAPGQPQAMKHGHCPGCGAERVAMRSGEGQDAPDRISARLQAEAQAQADDLTARAEAALNEAATLEEFRDRLFDIYKDMDVTELGNVIQKALVTAELTGRFDADNR